MKPLLLALFFAAPASRPSDYIDKKLLVDAMNASNVRQARNEYIIHVAEECLTKALGAAIAGAPEYVCHLTYMLAWDDKTYAGQLTSIEMAIVHYLTYDRDVMSEPAPEAESKKVYDVAIRMNWATL